MSLQFMFYPRRKEACIGVLRAVMKEGKTGEKIGGFKNLGILRFFDSDYLKQFAIDKELTIDETYELENYCALINFGKNEFNSPLDGFERELIYFDKRYKEALYRLWQHCKEKNISFCPNEVMQSALLHRAKAIERKLNTLQDEPVRILESIGISIERISDEDFRARVSQDCLKLFAEILKISKPLDELYTEFMEIAWETYQKKPNMKPHYLKMYGKEIKRLSLWYNTVAMDVLLKNGKNPLDIISIESAVEYWVKLRKEKLSKEDAFPAFQQTFHVSLKDESIIKETIEKEYARGLSTGNV